MNRARISSYAIVFVFSVLSYCIFTACNSDAATSDQDNTTQISQSSENSSVAKPAVKIPAFDRDSAYQYVGRQVAFGPRVVNTPAHKATKEWLVQKLTEFQAKVKEQNFTATAYDGTTLNGTNIIGQYNPSLKNRILLCAHWDSRHIADSELNTGDKTAPVDGADDGASGVGVLLEVARQLGKQLPDIGIDIVFLDAEDYGDAQNSNPTSWALGAQHFSRNLPPTPKPRYGILLDMVGAKGARFAVEEVSETYAPQVRQKVWRLAKQMGYGNLFVEDMTSGVTDDHLFINRIAGIPTIDIINRPIDSPTGFGHYWHTDKDNMDVIDKRTLRAVGQLVLAVIFREAQGTI